MDRYPHLKGLNSEVNEQANASLVHLKAQLSYMTQKNCMDHCHLYVWNKNRIKITGLQHSVATMSYYYVRSMCYVR